MSKENEMRFLKLFIYSMGVVMMLGVMIITYTIYKRNIVLDKEYMAVNQVSKCSFDTIKTTNVAKSASLNHDKLTILTEEQQVLIYDACTGKLLNKIKLIIE